MLQSAHIRLCASVLLGVLSSLAASPAVGAPFVDQSNSAVPTGNFTAIRSGFTASQTTTVGFAGTLVEVRMVVDPRGTPVANLDLEVQATTGGAPNGTVLASATVPPFGGTNPTVVFDVSAANLAVTPGQVLALVLKSTAALGNDYLARAVPGNTHSRGQFTDSGGAFASGAGWDAIFRTLVEPATLPGPGVSDQVNAQAPTNNFTAIFTGRTAAQTFTVGTTGVLTGINVVVDPRNSPVLDLVLDVQETTGGVANGTVVASAAVAPFGGTNPTVSFDVSPYNLAVTPGQVLAFVLRSNAAGGTDYLLRMVPGNTYASGQLTDSAGSVPSGSGWDAIFETFVYSSTVGVDPWTSGASGLELAPSVPNPVSRYATIGFRLPAPANVSLGLYDVTGRLVRTLAVGFRAEGIHQIRWNRDDDRGERVRPGMYFARLSAEGESRMMRVVVVE